MGTNLTDQKDIERKTLLILRILNEVQGAVGSRLIARRMQELGFAPSERAVRYHLKLMDERGLTRLVGQKDGRIITPLGIEELRAARVEDKVGLAISRIETLAFQTTFDPEKQAGLLPVNISLFRKTDFSKALRIMAPVFAAGFIVSNRVAVAAAGERLGDVIVPEGKIGLATVCSIVVNGVLLKQGVPMDSKFAGILQIRNRQPLRFVELIYYSGSSLDPSEAFIRANMTAVQNTLQNGDGMILANFREIPAICQALTRDILAKMKAADIQGVFVMGEVSEPVCQIPVDINKVGIILIGGLNPVACVQEAGIVVENRAMSAVMNYGDLTPFMDINKNHIK
jgi:repressor of nif and glnA expression